jgi:hypothetical protein
MVRWERLIRSFFDFLACLRQQLVSKSTAESACDRPLPVTLVVGLCVWGSGLLQGHGPSVTSSAALNRGGPKPAATPRYWTLRIKFGLSLPYCINNFKQAGNWMMLAISLSNYCRAPQGAANPWSALLALWILDFSAGP